MPLNQMQVRCTLAVALVSLTAGCAAQPAPSPTQVASSKALPASGTSDASGVQEPAPCTFAPHGTPASLWTRRTRGRCRAAVKPSTHWR